MSKKSHPFPSSISLQYIWKSDTILSVTIDSDGSSVEVYKIFTSLGWS